MSNKVRLLIGVCSSFIIVFPCISSTLIFAHDTSIVSRRTPYQGTQKVFKDTLLSNFLFLESEFDNSEFRRTTFSNCEFQYRQYISYVFADTLRFENCDIPEVSFSFGQFKGVVFVGCKINSIEFKDIALLTDIEFRDCKIGAIRFLRSNITNVSFHLSQCSRFTIEDCRSDNIKYSSTVSTQITLRRGFAKNLDVSDLKDAHSLVTLEYVELSTPKFSPEMAPSINLRKVLISSNFKLMQDYQADCGLFGKNISREYYTDAAAIYAIIKSQFKEIGSGRIERRMDYLMKSAERKALASPILRIFTFLWDEQLRGYYGTSPMVVVRAAFWLWLIFSFGYFILGKLRIAWGVSIEVSPLGETIEKAIPQVIVYRLGFGPWQYLMACLSFSIDQILVIGVRQGFRISHFTEHLANIPRRFFSIGFGRIVAGIENVVGVILLFNFVQAFLRSL
jgi:uncharacterized protein YjbI with pentapeptide repeats